MNKQHIIKFLDDLNEIVIEVGVKLVTILVPLPSAIGLYAAMEPVVGTFGAFVMALVIELFGMAAVDNNYLSWLHSDKVDPRISYWITGSYVVVAEAVIYAFKVHDHDARNSVFLLFPLLSIMGFVLMMNRRTIQNAQAEEAASEAAQSDGQIAQITAQLKRAQSTIQQLRADLDSASAEANQHHVRAEDLHNQINEYRIKNAALEATIAAGARAQITHDAREHEDGARAHNSHAQNLSASGARAQGAHDARAHEDGAREHNSHAQTPSTSGARAQITHDAREHERSQYADERAHEDSARAHDSHAQTPSTSGARAQITHDARAHNSDESLPYAQVPDTVSARRARLLEILLTEFQGAEPSEIDKTELGQRLNVSRDTIRRDLNALESADALSINGVVEVVI